MQTVENSLIKEQLTETIKFFSKKGWSPATSTNYSHRCSNNPENLIISRSGVDKSQFKASDFIQINLAGEILSSDSPEFKSSAETEIHTYLYQKFPGIKCVLHTHSVLGTVLSQKFVSEKQIVFQNYEIIKGIEGNHTHDTNLYLPIVKNSQNMKDINFELEHHFQRLGEFSGFLIAGHGLYAWGKDLFSAKRHIETFEFLLECESIKGNLAWRS